ncbi:HAD hydrolase family protein [Lutimaribacter sp. EGI FJ00015]|uniref:HAD hydrolase family protein n=1 Tax=Lutimaribacter degradans TaxID=2945989 RepID=A0ACC5ZZW0_9RHOB|nr:HAD hydrolase family protein [Lutimaribacter sp. EGI FJ00013]MCM2563710.1 HAD hydrolase family protein [Lutimaribacter sp. EGI FJ00013]MCO0614894.1 HAD hydrolase family protein [Lutimaribacter sp. EGI FJ00015]MCO0637562.1 HAD hydrolase family protein [Lutimaribacter sp. EGI FJ00014]
MIHPLPLLVFSDLDGTLLDHQTYDFAPARPALDALAEIGAGVVLASSKTAAEIAPLRNEMGLAAWPAIVENGAGLLPADTAGTDDDSVYRDIRTRVARLPPGFHGFADMSAQAVARLTGLPLTAARAAKARQFSEPGLWKGDAASLATFLDAARKAGLHARQGGRFLTLSLAGTKADRMGALIARYQPRATVALGDAPNDTEMLQTADFGVIVKNPDAPALPPLAGEATGRIIRTDAPGPMGWGHAIFDLLARLGLTKESPTDG